MGYLDNVGLQYLWTRLKDKFASKVHVHDDRYYTESEMDSKLKQKSNISHTHTKDQVGLSNVDNTADKDKSVKYATNAESASRAAKAASADTAAVATTAENATTATTATTALKLSTNAGSATQPVYFKDGIPVATGYTLSKSVPPDAKFTDSWRNIQDNLTSDSAVDSLSAKQGKALKGFIDKKADQITTHAFTIPSDGWKTDSTLSYPYYIDISITGITENDCVAVTISPNDIDIARQACFTSNESRANTLRLRARNVPSKPISASYYFIRDDVVKAFGLETACVPYSLPVASASSLGGIKIGAGLNITEDGVLNSDAQAPRTDKTLTQEGVAADSKAVGDAISSIASSAEWDSIKNKPTAFTPEPHTHKIEDVPDALPRTGGTLTGSLYLGSTAYYIGSDGTAKFNKAYGACFNDYAEFFPRGESTEPGDIIALDTSNNTEKYIKATNSSSVPVGVHSDEFAMVIGGDDCGDDFVSTNLTNYIPVALCGRVYVKVVGRINVGDYIIPSSIPGVGVGISKMTFDSFGKIIGQVVEADDKEEIRKVRIIVRKG